jgi:enoyl-CoA hydratase/carnithine racemase
MSVAPPLIRETMLFSANENANTAKGEHRMVDLDIDDGLAVITIDRPHARNAISLDTMDQLDDALDGASGAAGLVLTGGGDRAFVSGGDLKELSALRTEEQAAAMAYRMRSICDRIAGFPAPVLAALNGHALGGGAEFAVAADIRIAADDVKIGFNQAALGIMPAWGGAERLAQVIGRGRAILAIATGELYDATAAQRLGLIDLVVPRAAFDKEWRELAAKIADAAPGTSRAVKAVIGASEPSTHPHLESDATRAFAELWIADAHWAAVEQLERKRKTG